MVHRVLKRAGVIMFKIEPIGRPSARLSLASADPQMRHGSRLAILVVVKFEDDRVSPHVRCTVPFATDNMHADGGDLEAEVLSRRNSSRLRDA